jgi:uncharacterized protein HemY
MLKIIIFQNILLDKKEGLVVRLTLRRKEIRNLLKVLDKLEDINIFMESHMVQYYRQNLPQNLLVNKKR